MRILVVDDEQLICDVFGECLRGELDAEVECAVDGALGAAMLAAGHYDLALIEALLPGLSSAELADIAADENVPVLFTTGHPQTKDDLESFGLACVEKPFGLATLSLEAARIMANTAENIRLVRASSSRMRASVDQRHWQNPAAF